MLNIHLLIECRRIQEATAEVSRGIDLVERNDWPFSALNMLSLRASICLLLKNREEAKQSLDQANQLKSKLKAVPIQLSFFYRNQFEYYLQCLEDSLQNGRRKESLEVGREAFKFGKRLIRICQKAALYRTEAFRLMGVYYWLVRDPKSAFHWWNQAIREGETLGARPQLARIYAEMGLRLGAAEGKHSTPDAGRAEELLYKAQTMFRDLGLHQDLVNLESVINRTGLKTQKG